MKTSSRSKLRSLSRKRKRTRELRSMPIRGKLWSILNVRKRLKDSPISKILDRL
jgi:hypothetical protein